MTSAVYFVDRLTLVTWALFVWPRLVLHRVGRLKVRQCYAIDASGFSLVLAKASAIFIGVSVERLTYSIAEMHDDIGRSVRLRLMYKDLSEIQQYAIEEPAYQQMQESASLDSRLPVFLAKRLASTSRDDTSNLWRALHLVQASHWKIQQIGDTGTSPILFLERRPWLQAVRRYASGYGVEIVPVQPSLNLLSQLRRRVPGRLLRILRQMRYRRAPLRHSSGIGASASSSAVLNGTTMPSSQAIQDAKNIGPRVAVDYYGNLNLDNPERHSDLFFWQQSQLPGSDILVMLSIPTYPLDLQGWSDIRSHNMKAVLLHPGAATFSSLPVFTPRRDSQGPNRKRMAIKAKGRDGAWFQDQVAEYQSIRDYWTKLSVKHNLKVYVTWYKYDATHCAIADAFQETGGVTAIYQRAYESHPSSETAIGADIVFGFSPQFAAVERRSRSEIRYHVTTGYLGDHRFDLLRHGAQALRDRLKRHGAKHVIAYLDENTADDTRWAPGHLTTQKDYAFILEKVLAEPDFGLVIKPKVPGTLLQRLGPVAEMLNTAQATGRCHVFDAFESTPHGWHPPAEAALAADIAVHGHLASATAGMEAALAGVPTLLLDGEGWPLSPLYDLGVGSVVFRDWEELWRACQQHWSQPGGIPGLGDWSSLLDDLDPFRDGRAAQRMGTYIQWLIEGFQEGFDRETVMAKAAERYCDTWGSDKITQVNIGPEFAQPSSYPNIEREGLKQSIHRFAAGSDGLPWT